MTATNNITIRVPVRIKWIYTAIGCAAVFVFSSSISFAQITDTSRSRNIRFPDLNLLPPSFNPDTGKLKISWPAFSLPKLRGKNPLRINGGTVSYYYDYRSNIDTPFTDRNISQHNITGQLSLTAFNALPLNVSFFLRRSNSSLFADINDVRVDFDVMQYARMIKDSYLKKLDKQIPAIRDSLINRLRQFNLSELAKIKKQLSLRNLQQKLVECNEIIHVPAIAESIAGPGKADSVRKNAREFIEFYHTLKDKESFYRRKADSLENIITQTITKAKTIRETIQGKFNTPGSPAEVISLLKQQGITIPASVRHLLSIRRFSLGRSQLNYSELTARNISLNGINIEYNSWFYFALAAGTVDYRFRDFLLNRSNRRPQYLYLARLGVGRLEKNYIIFSAFKGQKQSYIQQRADIGSRSLEIYGISAEIKYRLNPNNYVIAEVAESSSSGLVIYNRAKPTGLFNWNDKTNKAYSIKLFSYTPWTKTRLEGMYRYTGAAFQSFDRFQVNSSQKYWYAKAEQYFWKRQLRFTASVRNNGFSNPYIVQQYSSSTLFKTMQLTLRKKRWPVISVGYVPSSQLTNIDGDLTEHHFHSLNAVAYHQYKIGLQKMASTVTFNRFYNSSTDTGFIYFNATNFYLQHHLFFKRFTAMLGVSHSRNTGFELNVLEESLQFNLFKNGNLAAGIRINNYNRLETKLGSWFRLGWRFKNTGWIQAHYDNGLIPGNNGKLVRNQWMSLGINKSF